ncbi:hypothetical protein HJC23_012903 [Cyclotella cryptica]|uniref:G-patch domain-containing protein n=1 Tax=Cyclotella cryptica TaxID=29204 RepID=A0ABD3Q3Z2_9STRA
MECGISNDPREERCPRCGKWKPRGSRDDRAPEDRRGRDNDDYYGPPRHSRDYEDDYDGRQRSRKSPGTVKMYPRRASGPPHSKPPGQPTSLMLDQECSTNRQATFSMTPKLSCITVIRSRSIFSLLQAWILRFRGLGNKRTSSSTGVARAVADPSQTAPTGDVPQYHTEGQLVNSNGIGGESKSKIAISLKTAVLPSTSSVPVPSVSSAATERSKLIEKLRKASGAPTAGTAPAEVVPQVHKKHAKDMGVWSERVKEMKGEGDTTPASQKTSSAPDSNPTEIKTTPAGQPICVLCRRKFANLDKLQQHEKLSALHKENLAKKAASDAQAAKENELATPEPTYRDRSKERRMLYSASSVDASRVDTLLASVDPLRSGAEKKTEVIHPEQTLGNANVGNQLLQKLGWKSGDALGRKQEDGNGSESKPGSDVASSLKNDWERIESLVQSGGHGRY